MHIIKSSRYVDLGIVSGVLFYLLTLLTDGAQAGNVLIALLVGVSCTVFFSVTESAQGKNKPPEYFGRQYDELE